MSAKLLLDGNFRRVRECRHGVMGYFVNDQYVGKSLDLYGEFSESEVSLFREIVYAGDVVVEVGANIGTHTLFFAETVGNLGRVLAFEPQRRVYQMLCANLALNEQFNVDAYQCGLSYEPSIMRVPNYLLEGEVNIGGVSLLEGKAEAGYEEVTVRTLDSFNLQRLDFLKIDVEGMEYSVLQGARETIGRCRPILYVENDRIQKSEALLGLIFELGYAAWWHLPLMFNDKNYADNVTNVFGNTVSVNVFCIPAELSAQVNNFVPVLSAQDNWMRPGIPVSVVY